MDMDKKADIERCLHCQRKVCYGNCKSMRAEKRTDKPRRGKRYKYQGEMLTLSEIAIRCGIDPQIIMNRVRKKGWTVERATSVPVVRRKEYEVEAFGERHTLTTWASMKGLPLYIVRNRLRDGWTVEAALTEPIRKPGIMIDGERVTNQELARRLGISDVTVGNRLRMGWTGEQIVEYYGGRK